MAQERLAQRQGNFGNEAISSAHPTPRAIRMRRTRWRKGAILVSFLVGADAIVKLVGHLAGLIPRRVATSMRCLVR